MKEIEEKYLNKFLSKIPKDSNIKFIHLWANSLNLLKNTQILFIILNVATILWTIYTFFYVLPHAMVLVLGFIGILAFSVIWIILSFIKSFAKRTYFCAVTEENFFYGDSKTSEIIQYSLNDIEVFEQSNALLLVIKTNSIEKKIILPDPSSNLIQFLVKGY